MTNAIDMGRPPTLEGRLCKYCGCEIVFARTPARGLMPLEVEPVKAADVPPQSRYRYDAAEDATAPPVLMDEREWCYLPHWGTCPEIVHKPPTNPELRRRWLANGGTP